MLKWVGTILFSMMVVIAIAQPKKEVRTGNDLYQQEKYKEAAEAYQSALIKQPNYMPGLFNLGNAKYQQKEYEASRKLMEGVAKTSTIKEQQSAANYNIGNTYLEEKKYKEAVEAYKEALRKNPQDAQAKYNMSYALEMLKNQQGGGGKNKDQNKKDQDKKDKDKNKNKDENKDKKDENKDQQDQQKEQDKKDQQKEQQQNKQDEQKDKQQKQQQPQSKPSKLSEQQAEQLLKALQQEEKKLQDKMKKGRAVPIKVEKDW